jgi:hypothetical protein
MSLLSVVRDVCLAVGVAQPNALFANVATDRTAAEMLGCATEMAQRGGLQYPRVGDPQEDRHDSGDGARRMPFRSITSACW